MGVKECSRKNCDQIMCETYISDIGYVCYECKQEFKEYLESNGIEELPEGEMLRQLKSFMKTSKDEFTQGEVIDVDDFFRRY